METIKFVFELMLLAIGVASLELAFQMFMRPNGILYPYSHLLLRLALKNEVLRHITRLLGRCRYGNAIWIAFYVYVYFYGYELPVLLMVGFTYVILYILSETFFKDVDPNAEVEAEYMYTYADSDEYEYGLTGKPYLINISGTTSVIPMLWAYLILGLFYSIIYVVIPIIFG